MDVVGFETAVKLKAAGFPEPAEVAPYTGFYGPNGRYNYFGFSIDDPIGTAKYVQSKEWTFAPTALDILRELPEFWYLRTTRYDGALWFSVFPPIGGDGVAIGVDKNPAEACAMAWLKVHKK